MALTVGELVGYLKLDSTDFDRKLRDSASQMHRAGDSMMRAGANMSVGVTAPLALIGKAAVDAASAMQETLSKSNTIFGSQAAAIEAWADTAATSFGQSKQEALDAAATFGNLFTQLDIGQEPAAQMSQQMVQLASDFASFHNADVSEVIAAQTAAFRGEYDAVQRFVPTINAAAVEQKALALGLADSTTELDAQDKALATQKLLLEGAGKATGDFARTADGLANSQRTARAQLEDAKAELGEGLLPVMSKAVEIGRSVVGAFNDLSPAGQNVVLAVAGIAAAAGPAVTAIGGMVKAGGAAVEAYQKMDKAVANAGGGASGLATALRGKVTPALGGVGVALGVGAAALYLWQQRKATAQAATEEYTAALEADSGAIAKNTRATAAQRLEQQGLLAAADTLGISLSTVTDAALGSADAQGAVNARYREAHDAYKAANETAQGAEGATLDNVRAANLLNDKLADEIVYLDNAEASYGRTTEATRESAGATEEHAAATARSTVKTQSLTEALDALTRAQDRAEGKAFDLRDAEAAYEEAVDNARETLQRNGGTLDLNTKKGRENEAALQELAERSNDYSDATRRSTRDLEAGNRVAEEGRNKLRELGNQYGIAKGDVDDLAGAVTKVPPTWPIRFIMNTKDANEQATSFFEKWDSKTITWKGGFAGSGPEGDGVGNFAGGGSALATVQAAMQGIPGLQISSTYRPGAVTASGNPSFHADASNPAVDVWAPTPGPLDALYNVLKNTPHRELLWRVPNHAPGDNMHLHYAEKGLVAKGPTLALVGESAKARAGGGEVVSPAELMANTFRGVLQEQGGAGGTIVVQALGEMDVFLEHKVTRAVDRALDQRRFKPRAGR